MAQDVGPLLEMVTERYLLRSEAEWVGRQQACKLLDEIIGHLHAGDVHAIGRATQHNFDGPLQTIIPWASNLYTETLIEEVRKRFGSAFWGFWMLGGMSGGGMGFIFEPSRKPEAQEYLGALMRDVSRRLAGGVPFAMEPVVYDFEINERGTFSELLSGDSAILPDKYYDLVLPTILKKDQRSLSVTERSDLERFSSSWHNGAGALGRAQSFLDRLLPHDPGGNGKTESLNSLLKQNGFDPIEHERIQAQLRAGYIGLAQNRLPVSSQIEDVSPQEVFDATQGVDPKFRRIGEEALAAGAVAVVTLAGGTGSRWTKGAGVVKALSPFCRFDGKHRTFQEVHLAKSRRSSRLFGHAVPHVK